MTDEPKELTTSLALRSKLEYAEELAKSDLIPREFQRKPANILIAMDMAERVDLPPAMVLQSLYVVPGKPAWSSQFLIARALKRLDHPF